MTNRVRCRPAFGIIVAISAAALIAGCGGKKQAVAGNAVQMRDLEVVDGTANDAMTDLDAVQADGVGAANAGNSARPLKAKAATEETAPKGAESVPVE